MVSMPPWMLMPSCLLGRRCDAKSPVGRCWRYCTDEALEGTGWSLRGLVADLWRARKVEQNVVAIVREMEPSRSS